MIDFVNLGVSAIKSDINFFLDFIFY